MWKPGHWFTPETFKVELLQMKGWLGGEAGGRFKVRQLSQWTAAVQIWQRIHVTLNYWLLFFLFFFLHWKLFFSEIYPLFFFVTHINGTISLKKNCSHKLFIVIFHLRTLMPLIGLLWLTNCIFLSFYFLFLSPLAFVFLPSRHAAEWHWASPCRGALLSHSSAHFRCPHLLLLLLLPQTMSFWLNTLSELLFCLLLF